MESSFEKPTCNLTDSDGNVFHVIARVRRALLDAELPKEAGEFTTRAKASQSYDEVLQLCFEYVDVT